jgi:excinuclease ABC subunit C
MKDAAARTEFERAAVVRDQIGALEQALESQRVVQRDFVDQDVFGLRREGAALEIVVMSIRDGKMIGSRGFSFTGQEFPDAEILSSFLGLYYDLSPAPPDEVLLPFAIADAAVKAEWLGELRGKKVDVLVPQRGSKSDLVELARKNAAASFASRRNAREDAEEMLAKLQRRLKLPRPPRVIECYDVSHVQGSDTVASMVVFVDGKADKRRYRTFKVKRGDGHSGGGPGRHNDDFASMYEVLSRRFRRATEAAAAGDDGSTWKLPDLIVVDGGKGQLGMALAAARDQGVDARPTVGLPIVALAKERDDPAETLGSQPDPDPDAIVADDTPSDRLTPRQGPRVGARATPDRVFLPHVKDAIAIRPNSAEMFVLQQLRDEAHRFAVAFHRQQRKKRTLHSELSRIDGIGESRQKLLLRHLGSLKKIREASAEDLAAVAGMTRKAADAVVAYFASRPEAEPPPEASSEDAEEDAMQSAFAAIESE